MKNKTNYFVYRARLERKTYAQREAIEEFDIFLVIGTHTIGVNGVAVLIFHFLVGETGAESEVLVLQTGHSTAIEATLKLLTDGGYSHTGTQSDERTHRKTGGDEKTHITVDGNERSIGKAIVAQH